MFRINVEGQLLKPHCCDTLVSDSLNMLEIDFSFSPEWDGMTRTAQFSQKDANTGEFVTYNVLIDEFGSADLPNEIKSGIVILSVFGVLGDKRLPTAPLAIPVVQSGFVGDGQTPIPPTPDLYQQLIEEFKAAGGGSAPTDEQVQEAVNAYLNENPVTGGTVELDTTLTQAGKAAEAKAVGDALKTLEGKIPENSGTAPTDEQVQEAVNAYLNENPITAGIGVYIGPDQPTDGTMYWLDTGNVATISDDTGDDEPEEPEVTLTGITATYTGGDVAVGTALADLTGIVVTATYSDGSTAPVTGYSLSGTIAEGSNTITVTYEGMTATFTVTGTAAASETWEDFTLSNTYEKAFGPVYSDTGETKIADGGRSGLRSDIFDADTYVSITIKNNGVIGYVGYSGEYVYNDTPMYNATVVNAGETKTVAMWIPAGHCLSLYGNFSQHWEISECKKRVEV